MSQNKIISAFVEIIKEQNRKQIEKTLWANSQYSQIESLKNDYSGRAGELLAASICENLGINYVYVEDEVNQNDGTYDIIINGRKESTGTYKFDFGPATLRKGIEAGLTLRVDASTTDTEIKKFFEDHIGK
jgi:hypothetical protein